jgi:flagellar biosynthetic protein FliP
MRGLWLFFSATLLMWSDSLFAADLTLLSSNTAGVSQDYNIKLQILLLMTALSLLPTLLLMMTSFTRIIIVLSILRQALGLSQSPPNRILLGIGLTLTLLIMRPVWTDIYEHAFKPYDENRITFSQGIDIAQKPLQQFMLRQTREQDLEQMLRIAGESTHLKPQDVPFGVLLPAYVLSELNTAFQIGFMIYIPFLVIDLVVASVLMAMGMMMLSPLIISLPFKLMIFVLVDGWSMTVGSLAASFNGG